MALRGRALFESLVVGERVVYRVAQELSASSGVRSKRQKRKWGSEHARWAAARVFDVAPEHIVVRDDSTGKHHRLSVAEVNNRLLRA